MEAEAEALERQRTGADQRTEASGLDALYSGTIADIEATTEFRAS